VSAVQNKGNGIVFCSSVGCRWLPFNHGFPPLGIWGWTLPPGDGKLFVQKSAKKGQAGKHKSPPSKGCKQGKGHGAISFSMLFSILVAEGFNVFLTKRLSD
jgi:hypothetical protein